jgi:hypothetical protein
LKSHATAPITITKKRILTLLNTINRA